MLYFLADLYLFKEKNVKKEEEENRVSVFFSAIKGFPARC